jgi:hypothetical protein
MNKKNELNKQINILTKQISSMETNIETLECKHIVYIKQKELDVQNYIESIEEIKDQYYLLYPNIDKINRVIDNIKKETVIKLNKEKEIFEKEQSRIEIKKVELKNILEDNIANNTTLIETLTSNNEDIHLKTSEIINLKKQQTQSKYQDRLELQKKIEQFKAETKLKKKHVIYYKSQIMNIDNKILQFRCDYDNNNERHKKANYVFYDIKEEIEVINQKLKDTQKEINSLMNADNPVLTANNENTENSKDNGETNNEILILDNIDLLDTLNKKLNECYQKPEYNLEQFYSSIEKDNNDILIEIDNLTHNKQQLEELLETKATHYNPVNTQFKTENTELTKKYTTMISKLNIRVTKNKTQIYLLENDNRDSVKFYKFNIAQEDIYDKNSHNRLEIATRRINEYKEAKMNEMTKNSNNTTTKIQTLKSEIKKLNKDKLELELEGGRQTQLKNKKVDEIEAIIKETKTKILNFKKIISKK